MDLIEKAIVFAARAHDGQVRKGSIIPYIAHPYSVGMLLQQVGCRDVVISAGILHDTIEDTNITYEDLVNEFGKEVADLVRVASEQDKDLPWEVRKQHTIDAINEASLEEIQVITADKLHNLRSIRQDLKEIGDELWKRFNRGKEQQYWYYKNVLEALTPYSEQFELIKQLEMEVKRVFDEYE